jgi:NADH:ubiquinone oxidoreductase subunit F (NADH-binding)
VPSYRELPVYTKQIRVVHCNCGVINRGIEEYIARDGYAGWPGLTEMTPDDVIVEMKDSGLRGRGGEDLTGLRVEFAASRKPRPL